MLFVLVVTPKHVFAEPLPGFPHIDVADVFYAPLFNDTVVFGAFGGYFGGDSGNQIVDWSIGNTVPYSDSATDDIVFSTSVGSYTNPAEWFERMRITEDGKVGIGTASPADLLEVASDTFAGVTLSTYSSAGADNPSELALRRARGTMAAPSAILSGDVIGWIFGDGYGATAWPEIGSGINFVATENWTDTALGSRIGLYTIQNGTNIEVEAMRIDQSGNVGIGTTSPQGKIHIHDGNGGFLFWTFDGIDGNAQTIIPDGTGDIKDVARLEGVISVSDGTSTAIVGTTIKPGNSITPTSGLTIFVNADGSATIQRTSGSLNYNIALRVIWL